MDYYYEQTDYTPSFSNNVIDCLLVIFIIYFVNILYIWHVMQTNAIPNYGGLAIGCCFILMITFIGFLAVRHLHVINESFYAWSVVGIGGLIIASQVAHLIVALK